MSRTGSFENLYRHGFFRVAAASIIGNIADPAQNAKSIIAEAKRAEEQGVALAVFPELSLSGYAIEDLVLSDTLLNACEQALADLIIDSANIRTAIVVGLPLRFRNRIYNTAAVISAGKLLGVVPKSALPNYREFYERRWFAPGDDLRGHSISLRLDGSEQTEYPFGPDLIFEITNLPGAVFSVEICEDMWLPIPPASTAVLAGATVVLNLSSSPATISRAAERKAVVKSASLRYLSAYVYAAAGRGESSNDLAWDGQTMIYERGELLSESPRFSLENELNIADVDLGALRASRVRQGSFDDNRRSNQDNVNQYRRISFELSLPSGDLGLRRNLSRYPFVPNDPAQLDQDCYEAFSIQSAALAQRLSQIGMPKMVIGLSGGLDSTHALLVCARAADDLGMSREDIIGVTMPGFATSEHTKSNAYRLAEALGITFEELDIRPAALEMLTKIGHPFAEGEADYDVTFENVQAGLRTDYLFRIANQRGGIVVGTGDLSELALGWCTYGVGDQMSHYGVNSGIPKTLMQHLIRWVIASDEFGPEAKDVLESVLNTEISPELVPSAHDEELQSTESLIGPYALHDFALYQTLQNQAPPSKIAFLAEHAWRDVDAGTWPPGYPEAARNSYDREEIKQWLEVFLKRFFGFAQFKRTAMPNGPKVSSGGALSPRGDWRAPSDGNAQIWLDELESGYLEA